MKLAILNCGFTDSLTRMTLAMSVLERPAALMALCRFSPIASAELVEAPPEIEKGDGDDWLNVQ